MKKVLMGILSLIMILGLVGCSSTPADGINTTEPTKTEKPVETESQTVGETPETIKELKLGETASTDIFELTLDNADLAIALENSWGENFFLPKEYNAEQDSKNPFVCKTGNTLVAFTFTLNNNDRVDYSIARDGWIDHNIQYIELEYDGQNFGPSYNNELRFGCSKTNDGEWEDIVMMSNVIIDAGSYITIRAYVDIPVKTENLEDTFKFIFHLPNSKGETEDFIYVIN